MKEKPLAIAKYDPKKMDVGQAVQRIAAANPQAVLMACSPTACASSVRQIRMRGLQPQFAMLSDVNSEEFFASLGDYGYGIGVMQVMPYPGDHEDAVVCEFLLVLKATSDAPPASYAALEGFVAAKLMAKALRRAGRRRSRARIIKALNGMNDIDLGGIRIGYSRTDHDGSRFVELTIIGKNGVIRH